MYTSDDKSLHTDKIIINEIIINELLLMKLKINT